MILNLKLTSFRNFKKKIIDFSPEVTLIVGPNAAGKTNILEAISLLSTGRSFKAKVEEEMIRYANNLARVSGKIKDGEVGDLEAVLTRGKIEVGKDVFEKVPKKRLLVNGVPKRLFNFAGNLKTVLFTPSDLEIVTESPSIRRKFLDDVISQVDREYRRATLSYEKGLRRRNKVLWGIREGEISRANLLFWDKLLIKNGDYVSQKREEFLRFANKTPSLNREEFQVSYDKSAISESRLEQYKEEEVAAATTLVGPHRDDFVVRIKKQNGKNNKSFRDLDRFGSRGEQRMGVLWLKIAETLYIEEDSKEKATILLDDIFSELDVEHKKVVTDSISGRQVVVTATEKLSGLGKKSSLVELK